MYQNNFLNSFKLLKTSLMIASYFNHINVVELLLEQKEIDINAKSVYLCHSKFIQKICCFKIIYGIYFSHLKQF